MTDQSPHIRRVAVINKPLSDKQMMRLTSGYKAPWWVKAWRAIFRR